MSKEIKLIVTADDYGLSEGVDKAVIEAIKTKPNRISTVTILMNFDRSEKALKNVTG